MPFLMAAAEVERAPFLYFVEEPSWTVTFSPADVDTVKVDPATLPTVPTVPPAAGPDRAFDVPPEAGPGCGLDVTVVVLAVLAVAAPPLAAALTMP
jgi:hypothetical protein